jgi:uncharacterized cofD-like protein
MVYAPPYAIGTSSVPKRPLRLREPLTYPAWRRPGTPRRDGPSVVMLGGGHGLAVALGAARRYAGDITAIVSVADDGGSSGRLRRDLDVPAPGDLRKALVALSSDEGWRRALEHRFRSGELEGHAVGNLLLVGLAEAFDDLPAALAEASRLIGAIGHVLPATLDPVVLKAQVDGKAVEGQVAVAEAGGRGHVEHVELVPSDAPASADALRAIETADQIVLAPGSLYTSVVAVLCVPALRAAIVAAPGQVVQVANLHRELPETDGLDGTDHLLAVLDHGARVDVLLYDGARGLMVDEGAVRARGVEPVTADVADAAGAEHDPEKLAVALRALLDRGAPQRK